MYAGRMRRWNRAGYKEGRSRDVDDADEGRTKHRYVREV